MRGDGQALHRAPSGLRLTASAAWVLAGVALLPLAVVFWRSLQPAGAGWQQIVDYRLAEHLWQTLALMGLVTGLAVLFGAPAAWFVSAHSFRGRRVLEWGLLLPFAVPGFVAAIAYVDFLEGLLPFYLWIRETFGLEAFLRVQRWAPWLFAVVALSSTLFPYVYLSCRAAFSVEAAGALEAARTLGAGSGRAFFRVALPMARPAVVAGASLVAMETINDYGVVSYFGLNTLTPGIFRAWMEGNLVAAMRLALILTAVVAAGLALERWQRGRQRFVADSGDRPLSRRELSAWGTCLAWVVCGLPLLLGVGIPLASLLAWTWRAGGSYQAGALLEALGNTLWLSGAAAALIVAASLVIVGACRAFGGLALRAAQKVALLGYALPSALVAVGVGALVAGLASQGAGLGWLSLSASPLGIVFAYFVRFLAVGVQPVSAGFQRVPSSLYEAARALGSRPLGAVARAELPLVWPAVVAGAALAFVDVFKELPLTLTLRPFDFETLATLTYRLTDEGRIPEAASPALCLVLFSLIGLVPLMSMFRRIERRGE